MIQPERGASSSLQNQDLSGFDGQRIAVVMDRAGGGRMVWQGEANYVRDDSQGNVLQITIDDAESGNPVIVIVEQEWDGRIIPDLEFGCKFCLITSIE